MLSVSNLGMVAYICAFGMRQEDCWSLEARPSTYITPPKRKTNNNRRKYFRYSRALLHFEKHHCEAEFRYFISKMNGVSRCVKVSSVQQSLTWFLSSVQMLLYVPHRTWEFLCFHILTLHLIFPLKITICKKSRCREMGSHLPLVSLELAIYLSMI